MKEYSGIAVVLQVFQAELALCEGKANDEKMETCA